MRIVQRHRILLLLLLPLMTLHAVVRETIYVCEGGVASYNGRSYTAGTYTIRQSGQEDIILTVLSAPRYNYAVADTIYKGETYMYKGRLRTFNSVGTTQWNDTLLTIHRCDSIIRHSLTVLARPTTYARFDLHICEGDSVQVAGKWYKTNGSNSMTLRAGNHLGGDSVITFRIYVHKPVIVTSYLTIKEGTSKQWYFHRLSTLSPGTHYLTSANMLHSVYGCDSIEVLYVTVLPRTYGVDTVHLCSNESVEYHGKTYSKTGDYTVLLTNSQGGDSVVTYSVRVHPAYDFRQTYYFPYSESFTLGDSTYTNLAPGYYDLLHAAHTHYGCDSIVRISLTVAKAPQTILWEDTPDTVFADRYIPLQAAATSALPVTLTIQTNGKAELQDNMLHTLAPGYATVTAEQDGNDFYLAAAPAEHRFVILRATDLPQTNNHTPIAQKILHNGHLYLTDGYHTYTANGILIQ